MSERMSPIGSLLWGVGHDATLRMMVGNLIVLDRAPTPSALAERLGVVAEQVERLRQRPDGPLSFRTRPTWVDDERFDPADHVRTMAVPTPGDLRRVLDLIALLDSTPFDPSMSPWDITIIEGLERGRAALYLRAHHCLVDGSHGVSLVRAMCDVRVPPEGTSDEFESTPSETTAPAKLVSVTGGIDSSPGNESRRKPGTVSVTIDLAGAVHPIAHGVANGLAAARRIDPMDTALRGVQRTLDLASSLSRQVVVTGGRMSPLSPSRSRMNRFEAFSVPGARASALALGGSRNDLLVAGAGIGLGLYHERLGISCSEFRLASPTRWRNVSGGAGSVVPTRVEIPFTPAHPGPLFGVVAERLSRARREPALHVTERLASAISLLPAGVLNSALRSQASSVDFVATSLRGIAGNGHICGAAIEESYPFGPRLGSLMNITGFGVDDRLDIGLSLDPTAIAEPDMLVECMMDAFNRFAAEHGA